VKVELQINMPTSKMQELLYMIGLDNGLWHLDYWLLGPLAHLFLIISDLH